MHNESPGHLQYDGLITCPYKMREGFWTKYQKLLPKERGTEDMLEMLGIWTASISPHLLTLLLLHFSHLCNPPDTWTLNVLKYLHRLC